MPVLNMQFCRAMVPGKIVIISACALPMGMIITVFGFFVNPGTAHLVIACIGCVCIISVGILVFWSFKLYERISMKPKSFLALFILSVKNN